ncbi:IclR family transcriptional regulator [Streptomyces sp. LHD-70]|uniref:IclR family transcriptional regulator n=1 Tax=Streptomyces sp. LHD-70 TaxID=3072140 RepID=UPI00280FE9B7|nr:IclR family transcriptional regulator [Streptomyces sp. LHD-70]MDQ8704972.1 IclR family transcriptional regulator [Streptomyces sp. LHD-70]
MADTQTDKINDGTGAGESRGISVLHNGIAVLLSFSAEEPLLGVTDIAARVGLHKSTVSRILATLELDGLVERDPETRRFRLGLGVIAMAGPLLADLDVRRVAHPVLRELSRRTDETTALMLWNGSEAVCIEQVPSRNEIKHSTPLGTRYNTAASSSVQVFLAQLPTATARALLTDGSVAFAGPDDTAIAAYQAKLDEVREQGYAVNYGETSVQEVGVAAPVFDHRGDVAATVLISAPRFRVSPDQLPILGDAARDSADQVTQRLGGHRPGA